MPEHIQISAGKCHIHAVAVLFDTTVHGFVAAEEPVKKVCK